MDRRLLVLPAAGLVAGFAIGRVTARPEPTSPRVTKARLTPPSVLPRPSLAEQHTILVGEDEHPFDDEDTDGRLILWPAGAPRVLTFDAEDVEVAQQIVERFVDAVRPEMVSERKPGQAVIDGVRLLWRKERQGDSRLLRVVALPVDPYKWETAASRLAEAVGQFAVVQDRLPRSVRTFGGQAEVVTSVQSPRTPAKMPIFDAAEAEFRERGLTLRAEEVAQGEVVEVVLDAEGQVIWSFAWREDQQVGTLDVRHYADPFDTAGEQEMLLAIIRRSLGREVKIRLAVFR
jgi:hypothetical protein